MRKCFSIAERSVVRELESQSGGGFSVVGPGRVRFGRGPVSVVGRAHTAKELDRATVYNRRYDMARLTGDAYANFPVLARTVAGRRTIQGIVYRATLNALLSLGVDNDTARSQARTESILVRDAVRKVARGYRRDGVAIRCPVDNNPGRLSFVPARPTAPTAPAAPAGIGDGLQRGHTLTVKGRTISMLSTSRPVYGYVDGYSFVTYGLRVDMLTCRTRKSASEMAEPYYSDTLEHMR